MRPTLALFTLCMLLSACGNYHKSDNTMPEASASTAYSKEVRVKKVVGTQAIDDSEIEEVLADLPQEETDTFYILITDTGRLYTDLQQRMYSLGKALEMEIDTMKRTYIAAKDLIALPEDDTDEIYRGDYFPRRFPSTTLSLEYLSVYQETAGVKTIALVAGIYQTKEEAEASLKKVVKSAPGVFISEAEIYTGCMH